MNNLNLEVIGLEELNGTEVLECQGGGFGPFGFGFRVFFKPAFIVSDHYA